MRSFSFISLLSLLNSSDSIRSRLSSVTEIRRLSRVRIDRLPKEEILNSSLILMRSFPVKDEERRQWRQNKGARRQESDCLPRGEPARTMMRVEGEFQLILFQEQLRQLPLKDGGGAVPPGLILLAAVEVEVAASVVVEEEVALLRR